MPRKPRIHAEGAVYHVILRGNARQEIFSDDRDRFRFYDILHKSYERFRYRIVAFCLMSNHIHLAVQVGEVPLSRIIQNVAQRYTQWFNWRHQKCGHLFQGRYKAIMVVKMSQDVLDIAWKCQVRLCTRFRRLMEKGKNRNAVITATARELAAFIWAIATQTSIAA